MTAFANAEDLATFVQRDLSAADTATAELVLGIASDTIRTYTHQTLSRVDDDVLVLDADGLFELWLPERPVIDVTSITLDGTLIPTTAYRVDQSGRLRFPYGLGYTGETGYFVGGDRRATIVYSHGFDPMRADIKGVCLELARSSVVAPDGGVKAEAIGNYSIEFDTAAAGVLSESQMARLLPYRPAITSVPIVAGCW